jgi:hypothetical protein
MRYLLVILFFGLFSFEIGDDSEKLRSFGAENVYDWHDCATPSNDYIQKELPKIRKCFNEYVSNIDTLDRFLHFIDLNNDKRLDIIYSGTTGAAADFVVFLINDEKGYRVLYEEYTNLRELEFKNNRLIGYTILDLGCCAEYRRLEIKYRINDDLSKTHIYTRATTSYTEFPKVYFSKPIKFIVVNEIYKMRSSPFVDDTSRVIYDTISNVVSTYIKGSTGYAWAEKRDNTDRVWWFVEMEPCKNQINSMLNYISDSLPMRNLGWMSSRYLKEIKY